MTYLRIVLQLFLAVIFLFSAYTKAIAPGFFEVLLEQQGMVPNRMYGAWATRLIIALETWLGICLMVSFYGRFVLRFSFALLFVFSIQLIYLMIIGETGNCGCFGEMIRMSPLESLGKNVILLVINGFLLYHEGQSIKKPLFTWGLFPLLFVTTIFVLPTQTESSEVVKKFPTFGQASGIDFSQGEYLVAILNLSCEHCQEAAQALAELQSKGAKLPQVVALFFEEGDTTVTQFNTITNSNFPYEMIDVNTFFDVIGSAPPRIYWIEDGVVKQFWDKTIDDNFLAIFTP